MKIHFQLNEKYVEADITADQFLLDVLREKFEMLGVKEGCSIGECGSCSVIVDGVLRKSCIMLAAQVEDCNVVTIEGVALPDGSPNDLQQAFLDHGSVQCGFCTPGMVMAGEVLLSETLTPSRDEIRAGLSGNLCRCTGYQQILTAIEDTAQKRRSAVEEK